MGELSSVLNELMETLVDGHEGYGQAADRLSGDDMIALASSCRKFSEQRQRFWSDLRTVAAEHGFELNPQGSMLATLHRGWLTIRDIAAGENNPRGVLAASLKGEEHALMEYDTALAQDLPAPVARVVRNQRIAINEARVQIATMLSDLP